MQTDDVLGKAYDARLMRRLLVYLRPYWAQVGVAFAAITIGAGMSLAQPYLIKVAIDRYIGAGRSRGWVNSHCCMSASCWWRSPLSSSRPGRCN